MTDTVWRKKDSFWLLVSEDSDGHLALCVWAGHGSTWHRRYFPSFYRDRKQRGKQEGAGYHIPQGPYSNDLSSQDPITSKIEPSQRGRKEVGGADPYLTWRPQFSKDYSQCGISRTRPWPHFLMGHQLSLAWFCHAS